jgi:hypothetical protein
MPWFFQDKNPPKKFPILNWQFLSNSDMWLNILGVKEILSNSSEPIANIQFMLTNFAPSNG